MTPDLARDLANDIMTLVSLWGKARSLMVSIMLALFTPDELAPLKPLTSPAPLSISESNCSTIDLCCTQHFSNMGQSGWPPPQEQTGNGIFQELSAASFPLKCAAAGKCRMCAGEY